MRNYIFLGLALIVAFAFGRYSAPEKVKVETKTVEVEKKTEKTKTDTERDKHQETTVTEIVKPDGTKEKTTKTVTDTQTDKKTNTSEKDETDKSATTSKEVTYGSHKLNVSVLAGTDFSFSNPVIYGGHVSTNLLGPITVGIWGLTNKTAGASLGLSF